MAPQLRSLLLSPCAFFVFSSLLISSAFSSPPPNKHVALFVFGDSLFDPGNNMYLNSTGTSGGGGTALPYGENFFKHPTGRLCDGRIVPDLIADFFKLPIWKAYLAPGAHNFTDGANFASAGAGVLSSTHAGTVISLSMQLSYFKEVVSSLKDQIGEEQTKKLLHSAVYLISIGGNDYFDHYSTYPNASASSVKQFVGIVTGNLTEFLKEIYPKRRSLGLPPI